MLHGVNTSKHVWQRQPPSPHLASSAVPRSTAVPCSTNCSVPAEMTASSQVQSCLSSPGPYLLAESCLLAESALFPALPVRPSAWPNGRERLDCPTHAASLVQACARSCMSAPLAGPPHCWQLATRWQLQPCAWHTTPAPVLAQVLAACSFARRTDVRPPHVAASRVSQEVEHQQPPDLGRGSLQVSTALAAQALGRRHAGAAAAVAAPAGPWHEAQARRGSL